MAIRTKEFTLSKKDCFLIITINYFKSRWWLVTLLLLVLLYSTIPHLRFLLVFASVAYLFWTIVWFWLFVNSKKNKIFFKKIYYEIDDEFITGYIEDSSLSKIKLSNIVKVVKTKKYYLLYISQIQFIYVPLNIFTSENDVNNFNLLLAQSKRTV
jgi:hypothetical protein